MAVESGATRLGSALPDITLPDVNGVPVSLQALRGTGVLVVAFVCNHCPYVQHIEQLLGQIAAAADEGVTFVAIVSNDVATHPDDDIAGMAAQAERAGWEFPYLQDLDQSAALTFGAACTPDFFVYGTDGTLVYRGAFDESSPKNGAPLTGDLLRGAIDAARSGRDVPLPHRPALGCGIKWLPGNEPEPVTFG